MRLRHSRKKVTSPARPNFSTNRPRRRCLSDEHGLVALGLAARAKRRCLQLFNDIRARGMDDDGPARWHATRQDQFVIWSSLFEQRWSISGGRRGPSMAWNIPEGILPIRSPWGERRARSARRMGTKRARGRRPMLALGRGCSTGWSGTTKANRSIGGRWQSMSTNWGRGTSKSRSRYTM